jgi:hypothetical protein
MSKKKVWVLIQSGYSARNFILSGFLENPSFDFSVWSDQDYIEQYQLNNEFIRLPEYDYNAKVNFLQKIKNRAEIYYNVKKTKNKNYRSYLIGLKKNKGIKSNARKQFIHRIAKFYANERGIQKLDLPFYKEIRKTNYYSSSKEQLSKAKPDIVFCTHQRASVAVAPVLAARDLGIRTICFVHSWDNVPKGVQLVKADQYFVWSDYMKNEMLFHYPFIESKDILVTGTPQFAVYFQDQFRLKKEEFLKEFNLNPDNKYILFSGNDKTSSPNDPVYLSHVCAAVRKINEQHNDTYRIVFRPNPIDRNDDFDKTLNDNIDILKELKPEWFGAEDFRWNQGGPNEKDITLLMNSILHVELVINVGSTMAIDAAILGKATCWINYEVENEFDWSLKRAYQYIHFKIIDGIQPVFRFNSKEEIQPVLEKALKHPEETLDDRKKWIEKVVRLPIDQTIPRMWKYLNEAHEV